MDKKVVITVYADDKGGSLENLADEQTVVQTKLLSIKDKVLHIPISNAKREIIIKRLDEIEKDSVIMFSYSGHSDKNLLGTVGGGTQGSGLAEKLGLFKNIKIVLLNGCENNEQAKFFLENKIPAIISTPLPINDSKAKVFAETFFNDFFTQNQSIEDAYKSAVASVNMIPNISINSKNRSLGEEDDDTNEKSRWILDVTDEQNLKIKLSNISIEKANLVLSDENNADKLKILCLYDKQSEELYNIMGSRIAITENGQQERVQNGIWKIKENSDEFDRENFKKEFDSAEFIFHFLNDVQYEEMINDLEINKMIENSNKNHIFLTIQGNEDIFKNKDWFKNNEIIRPEFKLMGQKLLDIKTSFDKLGSNKSLSEIFDEMYKKQVDLKFSKTTDARLIKKAVKNIPFFQVLDGFKDTNTTKLFYTLIESTPNCAETLLVNHVRKFKKISENVSVLKISFQTNNVLLIKDAKDFWKAIYDNLKIDNYLIGENSYPEECIKTIFTKISKEDLIIVFDGVSNNELFDKEILINFWNTLKNIYPQFKENFSKKNPESEINKLYVFVINNNFETQKLQKLNNKTTFFNEISFSPILPFSMDDFNIWDDINQFSNKISFKDLSLDEQPIYRRIAIKKICEVSKCNYLIPIIDTEILNL